MKVKAVLFIGVMTFIMSSYVLTQGEKHLFILSGQSNMQGLKPEESFIPAVEMEFGKEKVIVVKDAMGGQPIRRWYKKWKPSKGGKSTAQPDLYDSLMNKVYLAIENEDIATITFIWMQGERDARESHGDVYAKSLKGLYSQLRKDLKRKDINFVIGRLSDFDLENTKYPHWQMIREAQVKVADSNARFSWVDTDDLNDGFNRNGKEIKNDLHMSGEGYQILGARFAEKSIQLIKSNRK